MLYPITFLYFNTAMSYEHMSFVSEIHPFDNKEISINNGGDNKEVGGRQSVNIAELFA